MRTRVTLLARRIPGNYILTAEPGRAESEDDFAALSRRAKARGYTHYVLRANHVPERSAPNELVALLQRVPQPASAAKLAVGNFYANVTLRTTETGAVAQTLSYLRRRAFVAPPIRGATVVYDEESEVAGPEELARLAGELSRRHACAALAVFIADDDVLWYGLYRAGRLDHDYDSNPSYETGGPLVPPRGGDAAALATAFGGPGDTTPIEQVLRAPTGENGFIFEHERHAELVRLLGLPEIAVATGYEYIEDGELPEGLEEDDLRRVG